MGLLSLGIIKNDEITIIAHGEDELDSITFLKALVEKPFID